MDPRRLWQLLEPVHAVTYFAEAARAPVTALGVRGFWDGYAVARAAPLGPAVPAVVTAAFFGFHPRRHAFLASVWERVAPRDAVHARTAGAAGVLRPLAPDVTQVADLLWGVSQHADCAGRVLGAANQAVPAPEDPVARLWQATTTLREHRGDGHVASLVAHGIGPVEAMQLKVAAGESGERDLQLGRGWDDDAWAAGWERLESRGWVHQHVLTTDGLETRASVEGVTDAEAVQPWEVLSARELDLVVAGLTSLSEAVWEAGIVPPHNPVGVERSG